MSSSSMRRACRWLRTTSTGSATESMEGLRLAVTGTALSGTDELADGLAVHIDDGSGPIRLVIGAGGPGWAHGRAGDAVVARGTLGQRDSTGTGTSGYRLYVTVAGDLDVTAPPTPTPTPTVAPTPEPTSAPTPSPRPRRPRAPRPPRPRRRARPRRRRPHPRHRRRRRRTSRPPDGCPSARPSRSAASSRREPGRLGTPPLLAIADATGAIVVRLPDGASLPAASPTVEVVGTLADPYGQLEIRARDRRPRPRHGHGPLPRRQGRCRAPASREAPRGAPRHRHAVSWRRGRPRRRAATSPSISNCGRQPSSDRRGRSSRLFRRP